MTSTPVAVRSSLSVFLFRAAVWQAAGGLAAGFLDPEILERSDLYDLLLVDARGAPPPPGRPLDGTPPSPSLHWAPPHRRPSLAPTHSAHTSHTRALTRRRPHHSTTRTAGDAGASAAAGGGAPGALTLRLAPSASALTPPAGVVRAVGKAIDSVPSDAPTKTLVEAMAAKTAELLEKVRPCLQPTSTQLSSAPAHEKVRPA